MLKISVIPWMRSTNEMADIYNILDETILVFTEKK